MKEYKLGNCLRGGFSGFFRDKDIAWKVLSERFYLSFPSETGRHVYMFVKDKNQFNFEDWIKCEDGIATFQKSGWKEKSIKARTHRRIDHEF